MCAAAPCQMMMDLCVYAFCVLKDRASERAKGAGDDYSLDYVTACLLCGLRSAPSLHKFKTDMRGNFFAPSHEQVDTINYGDGLTARVVSMLIISGAYQKLEILPPRQRERDSDECS